VMISGVREKASSGFVAAWSRVLELEIAMVTFGGGEWVRAKLLFVKL
jgi:hypothetical protein